MVKNLLVALLGLVLLAQLGSSYQIKKFEVHNVKKSFNDASQYCIGKGMQSASILSVKENNDLIKVIDKFETDKSTRNSSPKKPEYYWTSGKKSGISSPFIWQSSNTAVERIAWFESKKLKKNEENCIQIYNRFWYDTDCNKLNYVVCERKINA